MMDKAAVVAGNDTQESVVELEMTETMKEKKRRGWFSRFVISCLAFFLVFGIINLLYYVLGMEPFGTRAVSIDDAKIQYIDFFTYYVDVLHGVRPLSYDFGNMLGEARSDCSAITSPRRSTCFCTTSERREYTNSLIWRSH